MDSLRLSRRQILKWGGLLAAGSLSSLVIACGGDSSTATAPRASSGSSAASGSPAASSAGAGGTPATPGRATPGTSGAGTATTGTPATGSYPPIAQGQKYTKEATITLWGFGVEETNPLAFSRVNAFKSAYPNIKIDLVPRIDDQKILTAAASRSLPDVLWLGRADVSQWAARGVLRAVDELVQRDKFDLTRFYQAAQDEVKYDNKTFGIPQFMTARGLYVNTDALQEAGTTIQSFDPGKWEQLTEIAPKLVKKSGDKIDRWGFDHKMQPQSGWLWQWGLANGGKFISDDLKKVSFNDPKIAEALDWGVKNYQAQGGYQAYQAASSTWQGDEQFARGLVAMTMYENFLLGIIARTVPELNFTVLAPRKRNGGQNDWLSYTGGNAWTLTSGTKDNDAAWAFITFMCEETTWALGAQAVKDFQQKNNRPYVPTLTADKIADQLQIDRFYTSIAAKFDDAVKLWPKILEQSVEVPVSGSPASKQLTDDLNNLGVKPAFEGGQNPKAALDQANQKAQADIDSFRP